MAHESERAWSEGLVRGPGPTAWSDSLVRQPGAMAWCDGLARWPGAMAWRDGLARWPGPTAWRTSDPTAWCDGLVRWPGAHRIRWHGHRTSDQGPGTRNQERRTISFMAHAPSASRPG